MLQPLAILFLYKSFFKNKIQQILSQLLKKFGV